MKKTVFLFKSCPINVLPHIFFLGLNNSKSGYLIGDFFDRQTDRIRNPDFKSLVDLYGALTKFYVLKDSKNDI